MLDSCLHFNGCSSLLRLQASSCTAQSRATNASGLSKRVSSICLAACDGSPIVCLANLASRPILRPGQTTVLHSVVAYKLDWMVNAPQANAPQDRLTSVNMSIHRRLLLSHNMQLTMDTVALTPEWERSAVCAAVLVMAMLLQALQGGLPATAQERGGLSQIQLTLRGAHTGPGAGPAGPEKGTAIAAGAAGLARTACLEIPAVHWHIWDHDIAMPRRSRRISCASDIMGTCVRGCSALCPQ